MKKMTKISKQSCKLRLQTEVHFTGILYMGIIRGGGGMGEGGLNLWLVLGLVFEPIYIKVP